MQANNTLWWHFDASERRSCLTYVSVTVFYHLTPPHSQPFTPPLSLKASRVSSRVFPHLSYHPSAKALQLLKIDVVIMADTYTQRNGNMVFMRWKGLGWGRVSYEGFGKNMLFMLGDEVVSVSVLCAIMWSSENILGKGFIILMRSDHLSVEDLRL